MRVEILAVGRLKTGAPERELVARYLGRAAAAGRVLGLTGFEVAEVGEGRDATAESRALLARLPSGARRVVLDERGRALSSRDLAGRIAGWRDEGTPAAAFLIGGADGHDASLRTGADLVLSLGPMTWPHQLVRALIAEQLYRAVTILGGHPYHRD